MDPNNPQRAPFKPGGGLNPPFQQGSVPLQQPNVPFQQGGGANTPFQQNGGLNAPFQPPNANGYIQPRPRQAPTVPPNAASPAAPAPNAVPILSPTSPPVASIPPQMVQQTVGAPPAYIMGGYQPRSLTMPDPEALAAKLNLDTYHVIRIEYFSLRFEPVLTIKEKQVIFNNCCIRSLEDAIWIHFLIGDENDNTLVVRPRKEGTRGAVRWCVVKNDLRKSRTISCERLTKKLYRRMNWQKIYQYKMVGTRVPYEGEEVFVFFLDSAVPVAPGTVTPEGKRTCQRIVEPEEWADSYGPTVKELEASTQIDLAKGFTEEMITQRERTFTRTSSRAKHSAQAVQGQASNGRYADPADADTAAVDNMGQPGMNAATQISMDELGQPSTNDPVDNSVDSTVNNTVNSTVNTVNTVTSTPKEVSE